jgi:hypothetical protein
MPLTSFRISRLGLFFIISLRVAWSLNTSITHKANSWDYLIWSLKNEAISNADFFYFSRILRVIINRKRYFCIYMLEAYGNFSLVMLAIQSLMKSWYSRAKRRWCSAVSSFYNRSSFKKFVQKGVYSRQVCNDVYCIRLPLPSKNCFLSYIST